MSHTPGPWEAREHSDGSHWFVDYQQGGEGYTLVDGLSEADARLIAAAPDLLKAAELVIAWYEAKEDHSKADFYKRIDMCRESELAIRAAIAKAIGEQA